MGIDPTTLPKHVRDQIRQKKAQGRRGTAAAIQSMKAKSYPHDNRMNKTERNYSHHLQKRKVNGEIKDWKHEPFNIRLADRTFYKPDFAVITNNNYIEIHEVKGRWMDDALVKIKAAAEACPWFKFISVHDKRGRYEFRDFPGPKTGAL